MKISEISEAGTITDSYCPSLFIRQRKKSVFKGIVTDMTFAWRGTRYGYRKDKKLERAS